MGEREEKRKKAKGERAKKMKRIIKRINFIHDVLYNNKNSNAFNKDELKSGPSIVLKN